MTSAAIQGYKLNVLGIEDSYVVEVHDPKLKKLYGMKAFLSDRSALAQLGVNDDTVLIFADASDILYLGPYDEALKLISKHVIRTGRDGVVLLAGERNCWPYLHANKERLRGGKHICDQFPHKKSSFRFLNAGAYAASLKPMRAFVDVLHGNIKSNFSDDQLVFQELYLSQVREGRDARFEIVVDHQSALFQTGHRTNLESIETYNKPESGNAYFDSTEGRVYNSESGNRPFLVHFNGGKAAFEEVARSFGLLQVSQ